MLIVQQNCRRFTAAFEFEISPSIRPPLSRLRKFAGSSSVSTKFKLRCSGERRVEIVSRLFVCSSTCANCVRRLTGARLKTVIRFRSTFTLTLRRVHRNTGNERRLGRPLDWREKRGRGVSSKVSRRVHPVTSSRLGNVIVLR